MPMFSFLQVPNVAQRELIKQMDLYDLVLFSFCSWKTEQLVKREKLSLDTLRLEFDEDTGLVITLDNSFMISIQESEKAKQGIAIEEFRGFGSLNVKVFLNDTKYLPMLVVPFEYGSDYQKLQKEIFTWLFATFKIVKRIDIFMFKDNILSNAFWNFKNDKRPIDNLTLLEGNRRLMPDELKFLLNIGVKNRLEIQEPLIVKNLGYGSEGVNCKELWVEYGNMIAMSAVMLSKCSSICLRNRSPLSSEWNAFFKAWISMEHMQNLQLFSTMTNSNNILAAQDITDMFEGIMVYDSIRGSRKIKRVDGRWAKVSWCNLNVRFEVLL